MRLRGLVAAIAVATMLAIPAPAAASMMPVQAVPAYEIDSSFAFGLPGLLSVRTYTTSKYTYPSYSELTYARAVANRSSTWQSIYTWPYGRVALMHVGFHLSLLGWDIGATWIKAAGLFDLWGVQCSVWYRYNGSSVWTDDSNQCQTWGVGFGVDATPVTWNEGGRYYGVMQFGANYRVSALTSGFPVSFGHWMRQNIYTNGSVGTMTGG